MKNLQKLTLSLFVLLICIMQGNAQIRSTIQKEIRLIDPAVNGSSYVGLRSAEATSTYTLSIPGALPAAGQLLKVGTVSGSVANMEWQSMAAAVSSVGWSLEGNAITLAGTATGQQFIGTTNEQPLVIATTNVTAQPIKLLTGNQERMRINANGNIGIGSSLSPTNTLEVGGSFRSTGNSSIGGTLEITGAITAAAAMQVDGNVQLTTLNGTAAASIPAGYDRLVMADNNGVLKQASLDAVLRGNGYAVTKARGAITPASAVENIEVSPLNGMGNAISIETNDVIHITLEGAGADMPIPSYYIIRNTTSGKFTIYFSAPFAGTCNWSVIE
jgi:hypothetical protein